VTPYSPPRSAFAPVPFTPPPGHASRMGRTLGQTFDEILGIPPTLGDVLRLTVHGAGSWLGVHVGTRESGLIGAIGWTIGVLNGIGAVCDGISLVKRAAGTHPGQRECPVP
jgi:hypothetical protein